ncbi:hypothetical protein Droror1_Dr00000622 [Drosera rotundifolia]
MGRGRLVSVLSLRLSLIRLLSQRHREATHLLNKGTGGDRLCVLYPKSGGALKPLRRDGGGNGSSVDFAHLFCSEWMPEVYVEDMRIMEPILNVDLQSVQDQAWYLHPEH